MAARPRIGINADYRREEKEKTLLASAYYDAVASAGGTPLVLPPLLSDDGVAAMLDAVDGILLTGGRDYDPSTYGEEPDAWTRRVHQRRESFDLLLARGALARRLPTLGICCGAQLLNIACGGDLLSHIGDGGPSEIRHEERAGRPVFHDVEVAEGSRLEEAVGTRRIRVNSQHHQAVRSPGEGLHVVAQSRDGVIEAVEADDHFLLGVQWHPELLPSSEAHRRIFEAFIDACKADPV